MPWSRHKTKEDGVGDAYRLLQDTLANNNVNLESITGANLAEQQQQSPQLLNQSQASAQQTLEDFDKLVAGSQIAYERSMEHLLQSVNQTRAPYNSRPTESFTLHPTPLSSTASPPLSSTAPPPLSSAAPPPLSSTAPPPLSSTAPPPPPGPHVPPPQPPRNTLLPQETLRHIPTRASSTRAVLGPLAAMEPRKGLSRILDATSMSDIRHFGQQLRQTERTAVEQQWQHEDRLPIFAVSYVHRNPAVGRFKFDDDQWQCFLGIVQQLSDSGVSKFRVWLDQCLWLRDASQAGWAHTGLLPYVMWPVLCLGTKQVGGDKSIESRSRMWPFVEEIAGLWGMGVIFAREMRSSDPKDGWRKWMSYSHRLRLEPEQGMRLLLINIFHGAIDGMQTGWQDDVRELKDMARANILMNASELYIGSNWKQRLAETRASPKSACQVIEGLYLSARNPYLGGDNIFLDGSRTVMGGSWNGIREWMSGHGGVKVNAFDNMMLGSTVTKFQVMSDVGEFALLRTGDMVRGLWMMVAMDGPTSNFSRGKVAWTKIMTGLGSCQLDSSNMNGIVVGQILEAELQRRVAVYTVTPTKNAIEWE